MNGSVSANQPDAWGEERDSPGRRWRCRSCNCRAVPVAFWLRRRDRSDLAVSVVVAVDRTALLDEGGQKVGRDGGHVGLCQQLSASSIDSSTEDLPAPEPGKLPTPPSSPAPLFVAMAGQRYLEQNGSGPCVWTSSAKGRLAGRPPGWCTLPARKPSTGLVVIGHERKRIRKLLSVGQAVAALTQMVLMMAARTASWQPEITSSS